MKHACLECGNVADDGYRTCGACFERIVAHLVSEMKLHRIATEAAYRQGKGIKALK